MTAWAEWLTGKKEMSYDERKTLVEIAFNAQFNKLPAREEYKYTYIVEIYEGYLIAQTTNRYQKYPYTIDGRKVQFGQPVNVQKVWVETSDAV